MYIISIHCIVCIHMQFVYTDNLNKSIPHHHLSHPHSNIHTHKHTYLHRTDIHTQGGVLHVHCYPAVTQHQTYTFIVVVPVVM